MSHTTCLDLPYQLIVREFFLRNIVPDADHGISFSKCLGLYLIWREQDGDFWDFNMEPSDFWAIVCHLVETGELPYEISESKNHMPRLNGCRCTFKYKPSAD